MSTLIRRPCIGLVGTPELTTYQRFAESLESGGAIVVPIDPMDLATIADDLDTNLADLPGLDLRSLDGFFAPVAGASSIVMLQALSILEATGLPTINRAAAKALALDKFGASLALMRAGIPQPRSIFIGASAIAAPARARLAGSLGYPLVVKGRTGSLGAQVALAHDLSELEAIVRRLEVPLTDGVILQHYYAEAGGRDFRIIVLDEKIIAVKGRWSGRPDEFRSAMPGYVATIGEISPSEAAIAVAATKAVGLDYSGVDLMRTADGPRVLEVNYNPFLATTERVTGVDIAGAVARALLERVAVAIRPLNG